ncbi:MAG: tRNA pseudouridine(38-40) synthase TruA [Bacteroidetes bacterium]|nr:tRNA pseudouridine(38-40) synthase TruA [Bacteroidota bacterium]MDA0950655.1 tRNA pseudouridine(38-40) synthase TruA [Bacteroidota bacterium]
MRYFLELAFDGTDFHGWQRQPNAPSIQQQLEEALTLLLSSSIEVVAAGRTDAGVHADQMFVHFDTDNTFDPPDLIHRLNRFLPSSISVCDIFAVNSEAHARFDAVSRSYRYRISTVKNPFTDRYAWQLYQDLDLELMNQAAQLLLGTHDFQSFSKTHTDVKTFMCTITHVAFEKEGNEIRFFIRADRFLRNMVRAIVGTLVEVGTNKRSLDSIPQLIASKSRAQAGVSVPAKGLSLIEVAYPELRLHAS